jgi:hypothetical protein
MNKIIKLGIIAFSGLSMLNFSNSFAGSFATAKGKYDFAAEYAGEFQDGEKNNSYYQSLEINNDFGITNSQSIGLDFFLNQINAGTNNDIDGQLQVKHKINFEASKSVNLGIMNALYYNGSNLRWELRGMLRHDSDGFYNHFRTELSFRKYFNKDTHDTIRLDLRTKFKLSDSIKWLVKVQFYFLFDNQNYIDNNPSIRVNKYFKGFKVDQTVLYTGPEFSFGNGHSAYVYYQMQLDASYGSRNHSKGFAIGYSKSFDL